MSDRVRRRVTRGFTRGVIVVGVLAIPSISASDGTHVRATPRCSGLARSFHRLWRRAPRACSTDTDCGCYPTDVERFCAPEAVDTRTMHALESVRASYVAAQCPDLASFCNPFYCRAACDQGRCVNHP